MEAAQLFVLLGTAVGLALGVALGAARSLVAAALAAGRDVGAVLWGAVRHGAWPALRWVARLLGRAAWRLWRLLFFGALALALWRVERGWAKACARRALPWGRAPRPPVGADGGYGPGDRRSANAPVKVTLRPVPTQRIATTDYGEDAYTVEALWGPELLTMIVAPPGVGKTELGYATVVTAEDGERFCGLATSRPGRGLLLSEMSRKTLKPALLRYDLWERPTGKLHEVRLWYLRPQGSRGHLLDVVFAHEVYGFDDEGKRAGWPDVIRGALPLLARGGYTFLIVDSLARWMGNDSSNAAMLEALGLLRLVTGMGLAVIAPHHCAKDATPPYQPRGGSAIMGELDVCVSLARLPGCTDPLHDPRRVLEWTKSAFR